MNARFTPPADRAIEPPVQVPKHEPFSWLRRSLKDDVDAQFVALVYDVCRGADLCHQLALESEFEQVHDPRAGYLSIQHAEKLKALASRSLQMLAARAEVAIEELNDAAERREAGGAN